MTSSPESASLPAQVMLQVRAALARGDKIEAIKLMRMATGLGLKESKEAVERIEAGGELRLPEALADAGLPPQVQAALAEGNKLMAIKLLREATGMGLKEALHAVEGTVDADDDEDDDDIDPAQAQAAANPALPPQVRAALARGHKIEAIKLLRDATGMGLKEAKEAVEGEGPVTIRTPTRVASSLAPGETSRASMGAWVWVVLALVLLFVVYGVLTLMH